MKVLVFLAGVLDPKWTLSIDDNGDLPARDPQKLSLSPFDEAALELALRLREEIAAGTCALHVCLLGEETERLARKVAAYKPDTIETIRVPANSLADRRSLSGMLVGRVGRLDVPPDVVLIGREFGDCDDGAIPPMLARLMGIGFVGLIHAIEVNGPDIRLQRRCDGVLESILHDRPMLASVTNDKSNRLRHPLMKNAMQARSAVIGQCVGEWSDSGTALRTASPLREVRLEGKCHILTGDLRVQTKKLAGLLREGIAT